MIKLSIAGDIQMSNIYNKPEFPPSGVLNRGVIVCEILACHDSACRILPGGWVLTRADWQDK